MNYIKKFQKENNLLVDGIIGANTLLKMKDVFKLETNENTAHFVGQLYHETGGFVHNQENLNYSAPALRRVFRRYFTESEAKQFARKPEKIANRVYANRMGNGNEYSGDGWKFRGKWSIQITGKNNHKEFAAFMNDMLIVDKPESVLSKYYWDAGVFFFKRHKLFNLTDKVDYDSVRKLSRRINGGYNGLQHRYNMTTKFYKILEKKKKKKKVDERQDINNSDYNTVDNSDNVLGSKESSSETSIPSKTGNKETNNSWGFFSAFIRWLL